jgi:uncharacterized damage-inducible protein DinB
MDLSDIREIYAYNRWANQRTLQTSARLAGEAFLRPMGNSFSSVRDTLTHILGAEWIWLERWQGRFPTALLDPADFPSVQTLRSRWQAVEKDYIQFIHALTDDRLRGDLSYINRAGEPYTYVLWQQMAHVVNHSSYHRGQITTLLRQLGAEAVSTDFLAYYDEQQTK